MGAGANWLLESAAIMPRCDQPIEHHPVDDRLHVITVISNPVRYARRYELFKEFERHMLGFDIVFHVVELAFADRCFEVTTPCNPNHVQVRAYDELWHKENLINIGLESLPKEWRYVAWVDGDLEFTNSHWVEDTIAALQHYRVVQLWESAIDLGPNGEALNLTKGFVASYLQGIPRHRIHSGSCGGYYYGGGKGAWHSGYAWAARRSAIDALGGIPDWAILGAGDHHLALALIGRATDSLPPGLHSNYVERLMALQERAERFIERDIGFVPGTICHQWHGKKADRRYGSRWRILVDHQYDPTRDIKYDWRGVLQLGRLKPAMRDAIRAYFRSRHEDSIDV